MSSLVAGFFSAYLGRKQTLWLACALNAVAVAIQMATTDKGVLYFGRLLLGLANGFFVTFSNVYTAEASPSHLRGVMVALFAYWVNIRSIFGSIVDNFTRVRLDKSSYQIPLGCLFIVPTILGFPSSLCLRVQDGFSTREEINRLEDHWRPSEEIQLGTSISNLNGLKWCEE